MKIISTEEIKAWCTENDIPLNSRGLPIQPDAAEQFNIPVDAGQRVALVSTKMQAFRHEPIFAIWFDDWDVWPSGQRMHLFDRFRLSYGESRPLIKFPGHILGKDQIEDAISFVTIAVLFLWDCYVVSSKRANILFFSHDEWGLSQSVGSSSEWQTQH